MHEDDPQVYSLSGTISSDTPARLSFSQIESFTVSEKDDETITLSVTIWPEISAEELLHNQPSYQELSTGYRREVVLKMKLKVDDGRSLVFAGKWGQQDAATRSDEGGRSCQFFMKGIHTWRTRFDFGGRSLQWPRIRTTPFA